MSTKFTNPMKRNIRLETVDDVLEFCQIAQKTNGEIEIHSGRYIVDGKSLLGVFSVNHDKELTVALFNDDDEEVGTFLLRIKKWMVNNDN